MGNTAEMNNADLLHQSFYMALFYPHLGEEEGHGRDA